MPQPEKPYHTTNIYTYWVHDTYPFNIKLCYDVSVEYSIDKEHNTQDFDDMTPDELAKRWLKKQVVEAINHYEMDKPPEFEVAIKNGRVRMNLDISVAKFC